MKKSIVLIFLFTTWLVSQAFVVKISNIHEPVRKYPITLVSELDKRTLDSIHADGLIATLHGKLDKTELCVMKYSFEDEGGVRTNIIPVFLGEGDDTINIKLTDKSKLWLSEVSGGELNSRYDSILKHQASVKEDDPFKYIIKQASENRSNPLGVYLVTSLSSILNPNVWMGLYHELTPEMAKYPMLIEASERIRAEEASKEGKMFQDLECLTPDGMKVKLSDYVGKGKYVLLDFWASWCGPCRKEAKETLRPLFEKYKDNDNFRIIGVMTSDNTENHLKALKTIDYPWLQLIDSNREAGKKYGFQFIPCIMLISPDGKIIRSNLRGEEIRKYVELELLDPQI